MPDGDADFDDVEARLEAEALIVDVDGFEGPLDLLLMLSRTQKVDLRKISVLARVSVVDYYGRCLFDSFVRVEERVILAAMALSPDGSNELLH